MAFFCGVCEFFLVDFGVILAREQKTSITVVCYRNHHSNITPPLCIICHNRYILVVFWPGCWCRCFDILFFFLTCCCCACAVCFFFLFKFASYFFPFGAMAPPSSERTHHFICVWCWKIRRTKKSGALQRFNKTDYIALVLFTWWIRPFEKNICVYDCTARHRRCCWSVNSHIYGPIHGELTKYTHITATTQIKWKED